MDRREYGSTPLVGSSRNTTLEPPRKARHTESLRFMPPESAETRTLAFSVSPTSRSALADSDATSAAGTPLSAAKSARCSFTVSSDHSTSCCGL